jgi:glucokinase
MSRLAVGIDLGGTNLRAALVSPEGKILQMLKEKTPVSQGPEATAQLMGKMISELVSDRRELKGIGIGSPGPLSRKDKMIFQTPNLPGFDRFPLGARVEEITGVPVILEHDAKCAAFGELFFGHARGKKDVVLLTFGTGIGGGVFSDGKMIYGKSDGACEIGHMTLFPDGNLCPCGNKGCLERYVSAIAIERRATEESGRAWTNPQILEAVAAGDPWAIEFLQKIANELSIAVASLVNIFEPQTIILAGGLFSNGGGPICDWVSKFIEGRCFASSRRGLEILPSELAGDAGVVGAAGLVYHMKN